MNAHFFGAKRAYYGTLRVARSVLAPHGLTPARFDLLTVIFRSFQRRSWQSDVRKALGVARATVARMVRSLEVLGLVATERSTNDKRQRSVWLTREGLARVRAVQTELIDDGHADLAVDSALTDRWFDEASRLAAKDDAESVLSAMRHAFGDRATLYYPWHPDD